MLPLTTTLTAIRAARPCGEGWAKLLGHLGKTLADDEPLFLTTILDSNGPADTLWVLENTMGLRRICALFAADCAEQVLPLFESARPNDRRPRSAIEVARDPNASAGASEAASAAANAAAWDAWDAGRAAARAAARAASAAARAVASAAERAERAAARAERAAAREATCARLRQYLIHGEAASALPWEPHLIRETML